MLGYFDLRIGETITIQPQTFSGQRGGWPSARGTWSYDERHSARQDGGWTSGPERARVAIVSSRVGLLLSCLRHYATSRECTTLEKVIADVDPVIAAWDDIGGLDSALILAPLSGKPEVSYYEVCYLLFRAIATRERELEVLDIAIAGSDLPNPEG